jgi:microcystin-dependent protein
MSSGISNFNTQTGLSFNNPEYPRVGNYSCNTCVSSGGGGCCLPVGSVVAYTKTDVLFPNYLIDGATWNICNGSNGTVDLRNQFIYGNDTNANLGTTGGSASHTLLDTDIPLHSHTVPALPVPITINNITVPSQTITNIGPITGGTIGGSISATTGPPSGFQHEHNNCGGTYGFTYWCPAPGQSPAAAPAGPLINSTASSPCPAYPAGTGNQTGGVNGTGGTLGTHTHSFTGASITGGTITGGTVSGATTAGAAIPITGSSTGTVSVPTTGISPGQTTPVPTIPPYTKLYYIERTA